MANQLKELSFLSAPVYQGVFEKMMATITSRETAAFEAKARQAIIDADASSDEDQMLQVRTSLDLRLLAKSVLRAWLCNSDTCSFIVFLWA
ncbi:MAG: hypothetical protein JKX76_00515 [Colwellia sp.]|nr:hypothetical protein [Colwellia sp.]